jgi:exodeoxyribonuclease III
MNIITWNVNGIRAVAKKGFADFLRKENPGIVCLQEVKISDSAREKVEFDFPYYIEHWNSAERLGYSGTAILARENDNVLENKTLICVKNGIGIERFDTEGRVQTAEFKDFYLVNAYFPNANHELSRLNYKLNFNDALLEYLQKIEKKKPFILCGDLNVAHKEVDLARPKDNINNPGFTVEERKWFDKIVKLGYIDVYRRFYPEKVQYTWWSYRFKAREKNIGWRIDYFVASKKMLDKVKNIEILDNIFGSDHCPVRLEL